MKTRRLCLSRRRSLRTSGLLPSFLLGQIGDREIWALFGSANQLLSELTLLWGALKKTKNDNKMMFLPMFFMLAVTVVALVQLAWGDIASFGHGKISTMGQRFQIIFALAITVVFNCLRNLFGKEEEK